MEERKIPPMFATELHEWELLGLVREISKRAKIPTPGFSVNSGMRTGAGTIFHDMPIVNLNPQEVSALDWTIEELKGILAHEIGHIALGHVWILHHKCAPEENWRLEFAADDFATRIGLGAELRSGLQAYMRWDSAHAIKLLEDTDTHPALSRRLERLPSA